LEQYLNAESRGLPALEEELTLDELVGEASGITEKEAGAESEVMEVDD